MLELSFCLFFFNGYVEKLKMQPFHRTETQEFMGSIGM